MDNDAKLRPLYLAKILYEMTDEDHYLTTAQLIQILEEKYGIKSHRQTIKAEIELLKQFGLEIEEVKSTQNRYNLYGRTFDAPELKLLIDAVESSKFITASKSKELVKKISSLSMFKQSGIEVCPSEQEIRTELEELAPIIEGTELALDYGEKVSKEDYEKYEAAIARRTILTSMLGEDSPAPEMTMQ